MADFVAGVAVGLLPVYLAILFAGRLIEGRWLWGWPLELLHDLIRGPRV